jgi:hypothetical protein
MLLISRRSPGIVFLLETHLELFPGEMLRRQLRRKWWLVMEEVGV